MNQILRPLNRLARFLSHLLQCDKRILRFLNRLARSPRRISLRFNRLIFPAKRGRKGADAISFIRGATPEIRGDHPRGSLAGCAIRPWFIQAQVSVAERHDCICDLPACSCACDHPASALGIEFGFDQRRL
jgi:hypothetical protein